MSAENTETKRCEPTHVTYLLRNAEGGIYFGRVKSKGMTRGEITGPAMTAFRAFELSRNDSIGVNHETDEIHERNRLSIECRCRT